MIKKKKNRWFSCHENRIVEFVEDTPCKKWSQVFSPLCFFSMADPKKKYVKTGGWSNGLESIPGVCHLAF